MPRDKRLIAIAALVVVAAVVWLCALGSSGKTLTLTVLDVGEGQCVIVQSPTGRTLVMDCGTSSWRNSEAVGEKLAAPYLQRLGINTIDVAVLSHPHADHISGFAGLFSTERPKLVLDIGARSRSPGYRAFLRAVRVSKTTYRIANRGQTIDLGGGAIATVLNPDRGSVYSDLNNRSIALRITYKKSAFLIAADAQEEAEQMMIHSGLPLRSQVLVVGHHGGAKSSTPEWLAAVRPQVSIISCGRGNHYGHPSREAIARLTGFGSRVYRTDKCGAVVVTSDGDTVRVHPFRERRP